MRYNMFMSSKRNKGVNIVFLLIMVSIIGYFYYKFNPTDKVDKSDRELYDDVLLVENFPNDLKILTEKIEAKSSWYKTVNAEYPTGDMPGTAEVESFVKSEVSALWCMNDEENVPEQKAKTDGMYDMYQCRLDIKYANSNSSKVLSHKVSEYGSFGGVHDIYITKTFSYDRYGKSVSLGSMAIDGVDYKQFFIDKIKNYLIKKEGKRDYSDVINADTIDNLPFVFRSEELAIILDETNGLVRNEGEMEVIIPFSDLGSILKIEYLN